MENEELSTGAEAGAAVEGEQQGAETGSQDQGQSQSSGQSQVETTPTVTSSKPKSERSNVNWANQRLLEKTVKQVLQNSLQEHLTPYLEEFKKGQNPQTRAATDDTPDYNDLNGWIQRKVNSLLEERLKSELPKTLSQFKNEVTGEVKSTTRMQEARNFLFSQKDVGRDEAKLAEIRQIMSDYLLDYAAQHEPLEATMRAVEIWRKSKTNPNTPPKNTLSTVTGGTGTQKGEPSIQQLIALRDKLAKGGMTVDEQEKLNQEIESLVFAK